MESKSEITKAILKKVRQVEIRTNKLVTEAMAGAYQSAFKGQGMDFEEVREYAPGDDVRSIDWNVTAKMDKPFIKKFTEERELTIMLLIDVSASGDFGSVRESKRELAAEVASVLAFSATRNNDKVGLVLFTDKVEKYVPPKKGKQHVLRLIREILFFEPQGRKTNVEGALEHLNYMVKRKAVAFVVSDFLQRGDGKLPKPLEGVGFEHQDPLVHALEITNKRHDLICVRVEDPREWVLPKGGILVLEDAETGEQVEVETGRASVRKAYEKANRKRQAKWEQVLRQKGIDGFSINTEEPYIDAFREFLRRRLSKR